jgi:LuxR family maltose regulon positive regulatory protein
LQGVPPAALRISTFGGLKVWVGARPVEKSVLRQRRAGELLMLLLISSNHCLSFDQVAEAFWPEKDAPAALTFFHHTTSALRRALEPDLPEKFPSRYLRVEESMITLNLPPASNVDYIQFEALCRQQNWEAALAQHQYDWLPEFLYAGWAALERQRLAYLRLSAMLAQAEAFLAGGQLREALAACQGVLALEPWQEQAALLGMRASAGLNDRAGALRLYRNLEKSLRDELGADPLPELQSLYHKLIKL